MTATTSAPAHRIGSEVGAALYAIAWKSRVSQRELGEAIGVSQGTMGKKLRGSVPITVDELWMLAAYLGTDPRDLLPRLDSNQQPSGCAYVEVRGYRSTLVLAA